MSLDNPITRTLVFCACISHAAYQYDIPLQVQLWDSRKTPLDHMVDVTNQFGLKVLYEHNFLNQNNVAFSPYGLTGIMVALYEGVEGDSSYQIQRSMELPWNRDVLRIGFRDIHRTLKTYFIPEEGFLAGLALNNENVTFKEEYRKLLRFYGFDLETDKLPNRPPKEDNTTATTAATTATTSAPNSPESTPDSKREETTIAPAPGETSSMEPREPTPAGTTASPLLQTVSNTQMTVSVTETPTTVAGAETAAETVAISSNDPISAEPSSNTPGEATQPVAETSSGPPSESTVAVMETVNPSQESTMLATELPTTPPRETNLPTTAAVTETSSNPPPTTALETTPGLKRSTGTVSIAETIPGDPSAMPTTTPISTSADTTPIPGIITPPTPAAAPETTTTSIPSSTAPTVPPETLATDPMTTINNDVELLTTSAAMSTATTAAEPSDGPPSSSTATVNSPDVTIAPAEVTTTTSAEPATAQSSESPTPSPMTSEMSTSALETLERKKKSILNFIMDRSPVYEEYLYAPVDIGTGLYQKYAAETLFLANGLKNVEVSYMVYDTVLDYTYLPHFKASAIRLPLDNDHYYLLVVLPDYEFDLNRLTKRLAQQSNLRDIYSALQPRYVHACVPSFMVKGFVTLTPDLQRLGIRDVFEPRQNDFSPMTSQKGVYVRNVEQSITVTIRKYQNNTSQKSRYVLNRHPVHFSATYPFLYFVMDSSIHVSLMAGKVMDPLNTRVI